MIPHNKPTITQSDIDAVTRNLMSCRIATGEVVQEFETKFAQYVGADSAVAVSTGSSALFLALVALGIQKGDDVIVPTYTCSAVLNAVHMTGATPVLVDVDTKTYCMSIETVKQVRTPNTRAIVVVHTYGYPVDISQFTSLNLPIVEDCCQAIGSSRDGVIVGSTGDIAVYSFYASKLLTTGHGGMITSKNREIIDRIRDLTDYDQREEYELRYNFPMTDFQAAMGVSQLEKYPSWKSRRTSIAKKYDTLDLQTQAHIQGMTYQRYVVEVENPEELIEHMKMSGVRTINPTEPFELLHNYLKQPKLENAEEIAKKTVSLPIFPSLTDDEVNQIVDAMKSWIAKHS